MPSSLQSPADIVNAALAQIGFKDRVAHLWEGSKAAKNSLDIYGQTRDQLLRQGDWSFAQREVSGNLIKSAPVGGYVPPIVWDNLTYPPLPWQFEYSYMGDCIKVRADMPPDFIEALVAALGRRLAPLLSTMDATKLEAQAEMAETQVAEHQQG